MTVLQGRQGWSRPFHNGLYHLALLHTSLLMCRCATLAPASGPAAAFSGATTAEGGPGPSQSSSLSAVPGCDMRYIQTLSPSKPQAGFGQQAMMLSYDGQTILLSGDKETPEGQSASVYLAAYSATLQTFHPLPQALKDPLPLSGHSFGSSLAVSPDASCLVIGSRGSVQQGAGVAVNGRVSMYRLPVLPGSGNTGYKQADWIKLQPPNASFPSIPSFGGGGLAISGSCDLVAVADPAPSQPTQQLRQLYGQAAVHIFREDDQAMGNITLQFLQALTAPDGLANRQFGQKVLMSKDAGLLVITDPLAEQTNPQGLTYTAGAVYIYQQENNKTYTLSQTIRGRNNTVSGLGADIGLAEDGLLLVVGEPEAEVVRVYTAQEQGQTFRLTLNITAPEGMSKPTRLGQKLALSGDGTLAFFYTSTPGNGSGFKTANSMLHPYHLARNKYSGDLTASSSAYLQDLLPAKAQCANAETCTGFGSTFALSPDGMYFVASGKSRSLPAINQAFIFKLMNCTTKGPAQA